MTAVQRFPRLTDTHWQQLHTKPALVRVPTGTGTSQSDPQAQQPIPGYTTAPSGLELPASMESMNLAHIGSAEDKSVQIFENISQRNSHIPHEVLSIIFIHCAHDHYSEHPGCPTRTAPTWVNVSYVCRYWRDVALNCSPLWTYIFMASQRWTEELLARSNQASLKICVRLLYVYDAPRWLVSLDKVMEHVERIQQLHLELPTLYAERILSKLRSPVPRLQNLEISLDDGFRQPYTVLFDGDTPSLRSLKLSQCVVPWYSFKLDTLTTLDLHCVAPRFPQTMDNFLVTLSCMRDLRELYLDRSLTSATGFLSSAGFNAFQKIKLSHLSRLLLAAPLSTVIALLSCVDTPATTQIRLKCLSERHSSLDDFALLSSLFAQRFMISENQELPSLAIYSFSVDSTQRGTSLTFSSSKHDCDFFFSISQGEWDHGIPLKINFAWNTSLATSDQQRIINDICRAMPLSNVQSIHLINPTSSPAFWTQTLGALQDLRYIKLSMGNMPAHLVSELAIKDHERTEDVNQGYVFAPHLEELDLYKIRFLPAGNDSSRPGTTRDHLISALFTRQHPQGRLIMTGCNIGYSDGFDLVASWGDGEVRIISENDADSAASEEGG